MLANQWFHVAVGSGNATVEPEALAGNLQKKIFDSILGSVSVIHGPTVLVEEDPETYALAVGDTRSLRDLSGFRNSGPTRHAVICTIEKKTGAIRVITDRVNFSKVFCHRSDAAGLVLTTHLTFLDRKRLNISRTGLASVIANGTQFNNLTLFSDVQVLDRASIHEFDNGRHSATPYWVYGFDSVVPKGSAKQKLKDALVDAIRDQVCDRPVLLSLSGGFDSSGILGVLAKYVKPQSLKTFSYVHGEPKPNSDPYVAKQMAVLTGYPHENVQAIGKKLYREAIRELAPEVFSIPRARTGQSGPDWRAEILKNRAELEKLLKLPSALDAVIDPTAIRALLNSLEGTAPKRNWKLVIRQVVGPTATRVLRSFSRPETPRFQSPEPILRRLLVVRELFRNENSVA